MTTAQIIIILLFFISDLFVSSITLLYNKDVKIPTTYIAFQFSRILFFWILLFAIVFMYNKKSKEAKGICPEYEKIENVYKLK